jgi:hypothetical protein
MVSHAIRIDLATSFAPSQAKRVVNYRISFSVLPEIWHDDGLRDSGVTERSG